MDVILCFIQMSGRDEIVRYSKTHKEETRRKLIDSSRTLVKKGGFDSTGVDALMSAIGLTAGAFYSHFKSKQELFEAVIQEEINSTVAMFSLTPDAKVKDALDALNLYVSMGHAVHPESGCVLPALGAELSRSSPEIRSTVEQGLLEIHQAWAKTFNQEDISWAVLAQAVGSLVMARSIESDSLRNEILAANRRYIEKLILEYSSSTTLAAE